MRKRWLFSCVTALVLLAAAYGDATREDPRSSRYGAQAAA